MKSRYYDINLTSYVNSFTDYEQYNMFNYYKVKKDRNWRYFKITELPRVIKCSNIVNGLTNCNTMLDVGTGRGNFFWYFINNSFRLLTLDVSLCEPNPHYLDVISRGLLYDARWNIIEKFNHSFEEIEDREYNLITVFEVLEHIPDLKKAIAKLFELANKYILISVPSKEDNNPEHLRVINPEMMRDLIEPYEHKNLKILGGVLNHYIYLIQI